MERPMKKFAPAAALAAIILAVLPAMAAMSGSAAFTLLEKIPPGEFFSDAREFLGAPAFIRPIAGGNGMKLARWGKTSDPWFFDVLHDEDTVRATRITWRTKTRSEQQSIFSQLATAGGRFFGHGALFRGSEEAEWNDFDGRWIVRIKIEHDVTKGVTMLSGIRDQAVGSEQFGF
ncbi:MAG: hypothetical protein LBS53_08150 [Synergistaceae bacterium]|jgi:hypothetical protein|nr:hypothetical protein [Synergistaceae bacterium]